MKHIIKLLGVTLLTLIMMVGFAGADTIALQISSQPSNKSVAVGATAKFTVTATGTGTLTYQWQYRKDANSSWAPSAKSGNKTSTLSVAATNGLNGYQFRCVVKDVNGATTYSSAATLYIIPKITTQPVSMTVAPGTNATFTVAATGTGTLTYQWQYRANSTASWANSAQNGNRTATLSVAVTSGLHGYQFRCVVTHGNRQKAYSSAATLSVSPRITNKPKDKTVPTGSTANFSVTAAGTGTLKYQWQYRKDANAAWASSAQSGNKTATLSVAATSGLNGYQFRCVITDDSDRKAYTNAVTLTVIPKITIQPESKSVAAGTTAKFTVEATGKSTLTYCWQYRKDSNATWANSGQSGNKTATLSVAATAGLNGYQFRCIVTDGNKQTAISNVVTLWISARITSQPVDKDVSAGSTASFSVTATGNTPLTYQWQYMALNGTTWADSAQSGNKTATLSVAVTAGMQGYKFRCVVTDAKGAKTYSKAVMLTVYNVPVTTSYFSDRVFRNYVSSNFDKDRNGTLSSAELQAVKTIDVHGMGIGSLKGIEFFTKLQTLNCSSEIAVAIFYDGGQTGIPISEINGIDASRKYRFGYQLVGNTITSLNLKCNTELKTLNCSGNRLTALDLSANSKLEELACVGLYYYDTEKEVTYDYRLSSLNLRNNTALISLNCSMNRLTALDLSKNTALTDLDCSNNELTSLTVSACSNLVMLLCNDNKLTSLNISGCTLLQILECSTNNLSTLNITNNKDLALLYCRFNKLKTLDISKNQYLTYFYGYGNANSLSSVENALGLSYYHDKYFYELTAADLQTMSGIITANTDSTMNRVEKIKAIHDWMVCNLRYDNIYFKQYNASQTLNGHVAVCSGYAALFAAFMDLMGIPNEQIYGDNHAWNAVQLEDGKYYYVDCTWDDPLLVLNTDSEGSSDYPDGRNMTYDYFLIGVSTAFKKDAVSHVAFEMPVMVSLTDYDWRSAIGN